MVVGLLLASIAMFIGLINRIGTLQINRILNFIGDRGRAVIAELYPPITHPPELHRAEIERLQRSDTLPHQGHPQFVQSINVSALKRLATRYDCVIEMMAAVGDVVLQSMPIVQVGGVKGLPPRREVISAVVVGDERTFEQDPKYALRLLVDIAIRALSPAINDPTTAVQALDQIEDLLIRLGSRRLEIGAFHDTEGKLRVIVPFPSWDDFVCLGLDEIRFYGSSSVQVMRRMNAVVSEMTAVLPEERLAALRYWKDRLRTTVHQSFSNEQDRLVASVEDHQGLGMSRR